MKVHHIGYLVKDIDRSRGKFLLLGYSDEGKTEYDPLRDVDILFMICGGYRIELVAPRSKESVVYPTLKKMGASPYHICYECDDIKNTINEMRQNGYSIIGEIQPAVAIGDAKVCFMYHRYSGLLEFVELT